MKLKIGKIGTLESINPGLFLYENMIGFKSEYATNAGAIEAYCVESGEFFWGGTQRAVDQRKLEVLEIKIEITLDSIWKASKKK